MKYPVITLTTIFLFLSSPCRAADFSSSFHSTYTLSATQRVDVSHTITITNNTAARYPTSYSVLLRSPKLTDLKLIGMSGLTLNPTQNSTSQGTEVSFTFPKPIVGLGKTQTYRLNYQDPSLILSSGATTEILIPPLGINDLQASISAQIVLPSTNCPSPITEPVATRTDIQDGIVSFYFDGLTPQSSLTLHCRDTRYITMNLNYILENTNMTPIETQITLPPDTDHQLFSFSKIDPKPINLATDNDGNPIATFKLEPKEQRQITVQANGILSSHSNGLSVQLSPIREYTASQPYWPTTDNAIKKRANELKTPTAIFDAIMTDSNYSDQKNTQNSRLGGKAISTSAPELSGQDYVDSLITFYRAAGIMSRRLVGITTTLPSTLRPNALFQNKLHAWADYYDTTEKTWISVDPTWTKTTGSRAFAPVNDINHIVLAINGMSDTTPYPAGFYIAKDSPAPEITVTDIDPFTPASPHVLAEVTPSFLSPAKLVIKNVGIASIYHQPITVTADTFKQETTIDRLPLGGQVIIPLHLPQNHGQITLTINQHTINVSEPPLNLSSKFTLAGVVVAVSGVLAVTTRRVLVSRRRR